MITAARSTRCTVLKGAGALATLALAPARLRAQSEPLRLGVLTPLTGAGSADGPRMLAAMQAVAKEVNASGGLLGRQIEFVIEDDRTNPDAAVKAARKLIDVDRVPVIMGTWASAVTTAVAPLCWESKTFLTTVSGADTITKLPHQGYLIRTQPTISCRRRATPNSFSASASSASSPSRSRRPSPSRRTTAWPRC